MLIFRATVDQGAMTMKAYSIITRVLLSDYLMSNSWRFGESYPSADLKSVYSTASTGWTLITDILPLCRSAVGVFYSPNRLGHLGHFGGCFTPLQPTVLKYWFTGLICHIQILHLLVKYYSKNKYSHRKNFVTFFLLMVLSSRIHV